jgi:cysteine desulfurase family protein (TIGR01976 family)
MPHPDDRDRPSAPASHAPAWPIDLVRARFPAVRAGETVFLDNASGAQVPQGVLDAVTHAMTTMQVNKGGAYAASVRVTEAKERVRAQVARFLGAPDDGLVAFGPNATTLLTLLAGAFGRAARPGDEIVVTGLDHHANVDPWRALRERGVVVRTWVPRPPSMTLELDDLARLLTPSTRLLAMTGASNLLGTRPDVAAAGALAHAAGALVLVDAVHLAAHVRPDVAELGADALVFSPYKTFGPHLGVLYLGPRARVAWPAPALSFLDPDASVAWEPGTQSHEAIHGFGAVFAHLDALAAAIGLEVDDDARRWGAVLAAGARHEAELTAAITSGLDAIGAERYGLPGVSGRTSTVAFNLGGRSAPEVAAHLARRGIAVAAGHAYAFDLAMTHLALAERGGAVRVSALHYNDASDVAALLGALDEL